MARRPNADLDALAMPKGQEHLPTPDEASKLLPAPAGKNYAHTLSLRLTAEQYRELRSVARQIEDEQGGRATHQSIIEAALIEYCSRWKR